tara:strand:- start:579 stop:962 length:384 start_codon:yes stop_codon:yes gene_type:complete
LDDEFIKAQSGPVKARREQAQIELENLEGQRRSTNSLDNVRDSSEDTCNLVRENIDSLGFEERRLGIEALDITAKVSDDQVEMNAVLGLGEPDSRVITTARTLACVFDHDQESYRIPFGVTVPISIS